MGTNEAMAGSGRYEDATARTWTHIKVLYILSILLSAVVLALFVVCFMMVLEVQRGLNDEVQLRKVTIADISTRYHETRFCPIC